MTDEKVTVLLRTRSYSFDMAIMKLLSMRKQEKSNEFEWHLGISSSNIAMFDIDGLIDEKDAFEFAERIKRFIIRNYEIENKVIIIRTNHGYHVVSDAILDGNQWLVLYNKILYKINNKELEIPLDKAHIELSIKYHSTTLRLSPKRKEGEIYKVIKVI